jgi:hypothetical protein
MSFTGPVTCECFLKGRVDSLHKVDINTVRESMSEHQFVSYCKGYASCLVQMDRQHGFESHDIINCFPQEAKEYYTQMSNDFKKIFSEDD